eukprot:gnl/TRDRNA2_/TRDRNA2_158106_c0_seq1.p1 gnl/TRDRNA2_/TRDRNA2_158106_c0~~gnl/TRDRNA2_/TRDRNA2_158106_c0_seq1.p1  ORF type:complete len:144 (+),score=44.88 gnl/TRDRNA2_/TRDRNA2_158106_c0_seq1:121-552(+)
MPVAPSAPLRPPVSAAAPAVQQPEAPKVPPSPSTAGANAATSKSTASAVAANQKAPAPPAIVTKVSLSELLQSARADWKEKALVNVLEKLAKIDIRSAEELVGALQSKGKKALNRRLKEADEKQFTAETLQALRDSANMLQLT